MPWLQHLFALCVLAHMLWAAILLQKEWQRMRRHRDPVPREDVRRTLARAEAGRTR